MVLLPSPPPPTSPSPPAKARITPAARREWGERGGQGVRSSLARLPPPPLPLRYRSGERRAERTKRGRAAEKPLFFPSSYEGPSTPGSNPPASSWPAAKRPSPTLSPPQRSWAVVEKEDGPRRAFPSGRRRRRKEQEKRKSGNDPALSPPRPGWQRGMTLPILLHPFGNFIATHSVAWWREQTQDGGSRAIVFVSSPPRFFSPLSPPSLLACLLLRARSLSLSSAAPAAAVREPGLERCARTRDAPWPWLKTHVSHSEQEEKRVQPEHTRLLSRPLVLLPTRWRAGS